MKNDFIEMCMYLKDNFYSIKWFVNDMNEAKFCFYIGDFYFWLSSSVKYCHFIRLWISVNCDKFTTKSFNLKIVETQLSKFLNLF